MFKWIRSWFIRVGRSAYDLSFYSDALKHKGWAKPLRHLYGVLWLTSLISCITLAGMLMFAMPAIKMWTANAQQIVPTMFPEKLTITIKDGIVSTNVKEPYAIEFPEPWKKMIDEKERGMDEDAMPFRHLVTIDTKAHVEDYAKYESVVLLTKTAVVFPSKADYRTDTAGKPTTAVQTTFKIFDETENRVIDKKYYDDVTGKILPFVGFFSGLAATFIVLAIVLLPFVIAAFRFVGYMVFLLLGTAVLWLLTLLFGMKRSYGQLYRLSLYGLTPALGYLMIEHVLGFHFGFAFTVIYVGWMAYVVSKLQRQKVMP